MYVDILQATVRTDTWRNIPYGENTEGADKSLARPTFRCILFDRIFRLMLVLFYMYCI